MKTSRHVVACALALGVVSPLLAQSYTWTTIAGFAPQTGSTDGAGPNARFNTPYATAADSAGNVYVADRLNHLIRKITPAGVVSTFAGLAGVAGTADGPVAAARFDFPSGIAVDATNTVYVSDTYNHTIRVITPGGIVSTLAGSAGTPGATDGTARAARFDFPYGLTVDTSGNVYVCDRSNHAIRKITSSGVVSTLAGFPGVSGSADGGGLAARFNFPTSLALDSTGNLIIADTENQTIRKLTPAGVVTTLAGSAGVSGNTNAVGAAARFSSPFGVALDSAGNAYIADTSNYAIRRLALDGTVTTFAGSRGLWGSADGTATNARFFSPNGICTDATGNFYVADGNNHLIRKITSTGVVTTLAGAGGGLASFGSVDGIGASARFNAPHALGVDGAGNLFIGDTLNYTVRKVTSAGTVTTLAGLAGVSAFNDGTGSVARFGFPAGIAVDGNNLIYLADAQNDVVRTITPAGAVTTLAGFAGLAGIADGVGSGARFNTPVGAAVDRAGNCYIADSSNQTIRRVAPDGTVSTLAGLAGLSGSADGVGSAARFNAPYGVAVDSAGNVYVSEYVNSTIRKISPGGAVTTLAGFAGVSGSVDATGANARFTAPESLAVDSAGNVFVADTNNHTIRKITPAGSVTTIGGQSGVVGSHDGTGTAAIFFWPDAIAIDASGALYFVDAATNVVVRGVLDTTPTISLQPTSLTVAPGTRVTFNVVATGGGLTYQWTYNGSPITGATSSSLALPAAQTPAIGAYAVNVFNSAGTAASANANLNVVTSADPGRLINLSILTPLALGETMTMGTALGGAGTSGTKALVARAAGPALAVFGLPSVLPDPKLSLVSIASGATLATNNDWGGDPTLSNAFALVGAFPYTSSTSKDAGLYLSALAPGNYTAQISDNATGTGTVIAELYDATPSSAFTPATPRLINVSVLKQIATGSTLTAGFVVGGSTAKAVLIRAVGPTLGQAPFNLTGVMADPKLELYNNTTGVKIYENNDWGGDPALAGAFSSVGAFAFANIATKDAALLITLPPGQYSARASGADGNGGLTLVEVYEVP